MWTYQHSNFRVHQIPVLRDNYIYLIEDCHSETVLVVDPALAQPVIQACTELKLIPTHILNTHHHWDHTDGNLELKQTYACEIIGNQADAARIPGISQPIIADSNDQLGQLQLQILAVSGHTIGHIAYVIHDALFCGDTLFGAGCGRLFEGTCEQMWHSLQKLAALDGQTKVYCAHEYTLPNLRFAREVDADNQALQQRIHRDTRTRRNKQPTIPSTMALEMQTNPFLRPLHADFCQQFNEREQSNLSALHIFQHLRERKNKW